MYTFEIKDGLDKKLFRLSKRNPQLLDAAYNKIKQILQDPQHYKNLNAPLQHFKRVHIGSFVLLFSVNERERKVTFEDLDHHDKIYK